MGSSGAGPCPRPSSPVTARLRSWPLLRVSALLASSVLYVYDRGAILSVCDPMPCSAPRPRRRASPGRPRRPSPSAAFVIPPRPLLCSLPRPATGPRSSRFRPKNPLQTVSGRARDSSPLHPHRSTHHALSPPATISHPNTTAYDQRWFPGRSLSPCADVNGPRSPSSP